MARSRPALVAPAPDDAQLKRDFAYQLLRTPHDPAQAAWNVFPASPGQATRAAAQWVSDPEVIAHKADLLKEHGAEHFLPTIEEVAREVLLMAQNEKASDRDRRANYELYAKLRGQLGDASASGDGIAAMADLMARVGAGGRPKPGQ